MLGYEEVKFNCTMSRSQDKSGVGEAPRVQNWGGYGSAWSECLGATCTVFHFGEEGSYFNTIL